MWDRIIIYIVLLVLVERIDSEILCKHFNITLNNRRIQNFTEAEIASSDLLVYINVPRQKENEPFVFLAANPDVVGALVRPGDTLEINYQFNHPILLGKISVGMDSSAGIISEELKIDISGVNYFFSSPRTFNKIFEPPIMTSNLKIYSDFVARGFLWITYEKDYRVLYINFPRLCYDISTTSSQSSPSTEHVQSSSTSLATSNLQSPSIFSATIPLKSSQSLSSITSTIIAITQTSSTPPLSDGISATSFQSGPSSAHVQSSSVISTGKYSKSSLATSNFKLPSTFSAMITFKSSQLLSSITSSTTADTQTSLTTPTVLSQEQQKSGKLVGRVYTSGKKFHNKKSKGHLIRIEKRAIAVSHCMLEHCNKHSECVAINYNKETKECELLSSKYSKEQNQLVSFPGWKYHEAKELLLKELY